METVPWMKPQQKAVDACELELDMARKLFIHVTENKHVLHRVDAWLDPANTYKVTFQKPAPSAAPAVPLRIGDVLHYYFWYLPIVSHSMVYVGAGCVVHYQRPPDDEERGTDWICIQHIDSLSKSQRGRTYVDPHNGYARLSRHRIAVRALMTIGGYKEFGVRCNCQHIAERIIGNKWFSIGIPRVVAAFGSLLLCAFTILVLALLLRQACSGSHEPVLSGAAVEKAGGLP